MAEPEEDRTSEALARLLGGVHHGPERALRTLAAPTRPLPASVLVWPSPAVEALPALAAAGVGALVVDEALDVVVRSAATTAGIAVITVSDVRLALAIASEAFDRRPLPAAPGVHASAVVHESARLGDGVRIGPGSVVAADAVLADGVVVGALCSVGQGAMLGEASVCFDRVVLYDGVTVGARARLHSGVVLGADGFGYAVGPAGARKIHHLAGVVVGDDVEIGANTAVDRGTLEPTRIGHRTKIDNLCQIGHNVVIGDDVVIAGLTGIAGSARIEDRVVVGGRVAIADHVTVHAGARLAGGTGVTKDIPAGETWAGVPAQPFRRWVRERYLVGQLERIWAQVKERRPG
jgi:UDP-3-O-[3-hydroxymyristoyl] glucosamine N-acyltransferase